MAEIQTPVERINVWQCIGCGKIEAPQPCIGVCRDRKTELVYAEDYDALAAEADALRVIVRQIAGITPRQGECERTWQALQARARTLLTSSPRRGGAPNV
jgi:hypothetical protein